MYNNEYLEDLYTDWLHENYNLGPETYMDITRIELENWIFGYWFNVDIKKVRYGAYD